MKLLTSAGMKRAEQLAVEEGISLIELMEQAGRTAAEQIISSHGKRRSAMILCGKGNNGGDGLVVARYLAKEGWQVTVLFTMGRNVSPLARANLYELQPLDVSLIDTDLPIEKLEELMGRCDVLVDAVFGTGFSGDLPEEVREILVSANRVNTHKYALDIPSGIDCDSGFYDPDTFRAQTTFAFAAEKPAHRLKRSRALCGEVVVCDIGITSEQIYAVSGCITLLEDMQIRPMIPPRKADSNKGTYGKLLNVGGSAEMIGATVLSSLAALRCGVGLVKTAAPKSAIYSLSAHAPECIYAAMKLDHDGSMSLDNLDRLLREQQWATAMLIGCGLSVTDSTRMLVEELLRRSEIPVVVDADGLNALASDPSILKEVKAPVVLTPHIVEMSRLTGLSVEAIKGRRFSVASEFAQEHRVTVVLKDSNTVVAAPNGRLWMNENGNSGLSKGGSGDVLAGMIASLIAQGAEPSYAAAAAVWMHAEAADLAAKVLSEYAMQPSDVIENLPFVFCDLFGETAR